MPERSVQLFSIGHSNVEAHKLIGRGVTVWHIMHDGSLEPDTIEARQMRMF